MIPRGIGSSNERLTGNSRPDLPSASPPTDTPSPMTTELRVAAKITARPIFILQGGEVIAEEEEGRPHAGEEGQEEVAAPIARWKAAYDASDGCTLALPIAPECCRRHDADYTTGTDEAGNPLTRAQADQRLYECILSAGYPKMAWWRWAAVRAGAASRWLLSKQVDTRPTSDDPRLNA